MSPQGEYFLLKHIMQSVGFNDFALLLTGIPYIVPNMADIIDYPNGALYTSPKFSLMRSTTGVPCYGLQCIYQHTLYQRYCPVFNADTLQLSCAKRHSHGCEAFITVDRDGKLLQGPEDHNRIDADDLD